MTLNLGAAMRIPWVRLILTTLATGTISGGARAQAHGPSPAADLAKGVANQSRIRVRLASGPTFELRDAAVNGTTLIGRSGDTDSLAGYQVEELEHVWRRGSAARQGFFIGAGLGLIGGAIAGVAAANWCLDLFGGGCAPASTGRQLKGAVGGALIGGAVVGLVGKVIASPMKRWRTIYESGHGRVTPIISTHQIGLSFAF